MCVSVCVCGYTGGCSSYLQDLRAGLDRLAQCLQLAARLVEELKIWKGRRRAIINKLAISTHLGATAASDVLAKWVERLKFMFFCFPFNLFLTSWAN